LRHVKRSRQLLHHRIILGAVDDADVGHPGLFQTGAPFPVQGGNLVEGLAAGGCHLGNGLYRANSCIIEVQVDPVHWQDPDKVIQGAADRRLYIK